MENQTTETEATQAELTAPKEATQADLTTPKNVPLNAFPPELYRKLHPGYEAWNKDRIPTSPFSGYLIYLLSDPENIGQQLADRDSRIEEIIRENDRLETEVSRLTQALPTQELQERVKYLEEENEGLVEINLSFASENKELRAKIEVLESRLSSVPEFIKTSVISGKYNETAILAAIDVVMEKAAELSAPGLFNKFKTYTVEDFRAIFREAYTQALPK